MQRQAYSRITLKSVDAKERRIAGLATSPRLDRHGDRINPLGCKFEASVPFLWQHDHSAPIGSVEFERPTVDGVKFNAHIPKVDEEGVLKSRVDEAWQSIQHGLVKAVSIGFAPIDYEFQPEGGIYFAEIEILELSAVTVPANSDCSISEIKHFDNLAKYGGRRRVRLTPEEMAVGKRLVARSFSL